MLDLIIIGGSAAATSAGVYAARRGLNVKIIAKEFGGEVATSGEIENWPGVPHTDGLTLSEQFKSHLAANKVELEDGVWVTMVTKQADGTICISTGNETETMANDRLKPEPESIKCDYTAKAVIVATGVHPKILGVPGEKEYRNKGVTYCTTCDGPLFTGKVTTVVGGGNGALESALMLADVASQVYVLNKNTFFKGDKVLIDKLLTKKNVQIIYSAMVAEIVGEQLVTELKYKDQAGAIQNLKTDGVFVHIGNIPNSMLVSEDVARNKFGEIIVDANCATNVPGLFAAGDVTNVPFKQIVIAAGQGCIAALSAVQYLNRKS